MMAAARQESTLFSPDRGISRSFGVIPVFVAVVAERSKALVLGTSLRARVRIPPTVIPSEYNLACTSIVRMPHSVLTPIATQMLMVTKLARLAQLVRAWV